MYEEILTNKEEILKRAWPSLVMKNDEYLKDKMHVPFLDMEIVWNVKLTHNSSTVLLKSIAQYNKITEEDLMNNIPNHRNNYCWQTVVSRMNELAEELGNDAVYLAADEPRSGIIVTNKESYRGSGALLYTDIFETLSKVADGDMYIIPSSIHELLVLFADAGGNSAAYAREMIREVNDNSVEPEERLSYNVYRYNRDKNEIYIG